MILDFKVIPHKKQRYDTVGDYFLKKGRRFFRLSRMPDKPHPITVFLHEMIEFFLCRVLGISMKEIDRFDMEYELAHSGPVCPIQAPCGRRWYEEPGDNPHATTINSCYSDSLRAIDCEALGVKWSEYNAGSRGVIACAEDRTTATWKRRAKQFANRCPRTRPR
jgi:hypothetical protein